MPGQRRQRRSASRARMAGMVPASASALTARQRSSFSTLRPRPGFRAPQPAPRAPVPAQRPGQQGAGSRVDPVPRGARSPSATALRPGTESFRRPSARPRLPGCAGSSGHARRTTFRRAGCRGASHEFGAVLVMHGARDIVPISRRADLPSTTRTGRLPPDSTRATGPCWPAPRRRPASRRHRRIAAGGLRRP